MADYAAQSLSPATLLTPTWRAAAAGGDRISPFSERVLLLVKNVNAAARTLTVQGNVEPYFGTAPDKAYTLGGTMTDPVVVGIFRADAFRSEAGTLDLTWSSEVGVTFAAISVP